MSAKPGEMIPGAKGFNPERIHAVLGLFPKLELGKIHMLCTKCGARQPNTDKDEAEPRKAAFCLMKCPICTPQAEYETNDTEYLDEDGNKVSLFEI